MRTSRILSVNRGFAAILFLGLMVAVVTFTGVFYLKQNRKIIPANQSASTPPESTNSSDVKARYGTEENNYLRVIDVSSPMPNGWRTFSYKYPIIRFSFNLPPGWKDTTSRHNYDDPPQFIQLRNYDENEVPVSELSEPPKNGRMKIEIYIDKLEESLEEYVQRSKQDAEFRHGIETVEMEMTIDEQKAIRSTSKDLSSVAVKYPTEQVIFDFNFYGFDNNLNLSNQILSAFKFIN